jgi:hypothetical protein
VLTELAANGHLAYAALCLFALAAGPEKKLLVHETLLSGSYWRKLHNAEFHGFLRLIQYSGNKINVKEMVGALHTYGCEGKCIQYFVREI